MLAPGSSVGPYQVTSRIGEGGMGEVYKAHDPRLGRDVALKISHEAFTDRFAREARSIAALNHTKRRNRRADATPTGAPTSGPSASSSTSC